jgi:galactokinase/mevalonate kinase-like predicted kinase
MMATRFVVYGVHKDDKDTFVENHTDDFKEALMLADIQRSADYVSRIWDHERKKFISQRVIDRAIEFYGKRGT